MDASGNLYIADSGNSRVRMVSSSGIITTVAGSGGGNSLGDGGAATSALLENPTGVAVDAAGDLYIADYYNNRIRKVAATGIITTVAGNGSSGFAGDGGAATSAQLAYPAGVAVDASGNLYVADFGNAKIRKVTTAGVIATLVGGALGDGGLGVFGVLNQPSGVARDNAGNTYVADAYNNRIRKVTANGTITTVAGTGVAGFSGDGGAAASAQLNSPQGVTLDASGNLYIADSNNYRVRKVDGQRHDHYGSGQRLIHLSGRRRGCHQRGDRQYFRPGIRRLRKPVYFRWQLQRNPEGGRVGNHHDGCGQRRLRLHG